MDRKVFSPMTKPESATLGILASLNPPRLLKKEHEKVKKVMEDWKPIPGVPKYEASTMGRIRRVLIMGYHLLVPCPSIARGGKKYLKVHMGRKKQNVMVHRIIALTFLGPPAFEKARVGHLNDDGEDNRLENLRYVDDKENTAMKAQYQQKVWGICAICGHDASHHDPDYGNQCSLCKVCPGFVLKKEPTVEPQEPKAKDHRGDEDVGEIGGYSDQHSDTREVMVS